MAVQKNTKNAPFYSIGQLRLSHWHELKNVCVELSQCKKGTAIEKKLRVEVEELLQQLKVVEQYFVFPGKIRVEKLGNYLSRFEYTALANNISPTPLIN